MDAYVSTAWKILQVVGATVVYAYCAATVVLAVMALCRAVRGDNGNAFPSKSSEEGAEG